MSAYLARLKQLENVKNSYYAPDTVPPKPPKAPFDPFEGTGAGHIEKNIIVDAEIVAPPEASKPMTPMELRLQKVIDMLKAEPGTRFAVTVEDAVETDPVICTIAIRGKAAFEVEIPLKFYDVLALLELIEKHSLEPQHDGGVNLCSFQDARPRSP